MKNSITENQIEVVTQIILICCKKPEYRKEHHKLMFKFAVYGKGRLHHIVN